jgi:hypothetical protein
LYVAAIRGAALFREIVRAGLVRRAAHRGP